MGLGQRLWGRGGNHFLASGQAGALVVLVPQRGRVCPLTPHLLPCESTCYLILYLHVEIWVLLGIQGHKCLLWKILKTSLASALIYMYTYLPRPGL